MRTLFLRRFASVLATTVLVASASSTRALPIYGGPTYDSSTGTGSPSAIEQTNPGNSAGNGSAVGWADKSIAGVNVGSRPYRWNSSGAITELEILGTDSSGYSNLNIAYAINSAGTAAGIADKYVSGVYKGPRAVRWDAASSAAIELGNLGTDGTGFTVANAYALNTTGTVVGTADKYVSGVPLGRYAVRWDAGSTTAIALGLLDNLSSPSFSAVYAINDTGIAAGVANKYGPSGDKGTRAVRWSTSGAITELGNLGTDASGSTTAEADALNSLGATVGMATRYDAGVSVGMRAVRWDASSSAATELGNLGTDVTGSTNSYARSINTTGTAVGFVEKYLSGVDKGERAVRWDASVTAATELGNLGTDSSGLTDSRAYAINAAGFAVGFAEKFTAGTDFGQHAVAWRLDGTAIDLNTLLAPGSGWVVLSQAIGISDPGWISGYGTFDADGAGPLAPYQRVFLLDARSLMPVPEPASAVVLAFGAGALVLRRRQLQR